MKTVHEAAAQYRPERSKFKNKVGAPTKFTHKTREKIINAVKIGATYELAALYAGISYDSFNNWMKQGKKDKQGEYFDFFNSVKEAEGFGAVMWLTKIEKAASSGNWQAAAWKLERRYPNQYGKSVQAHEIYGKDGKAIQHASYVAIIPAESSLEDWTKDNMAAPSRTANDADEMSD